MLDNGLFFRFMENDFFCFIYILKEIKGRGAGGIYNFYILFTPQSDKNQVFKKMHVV